MLLKRKLLVCAVIFSFFESNLHASKADFMPEDYPQTWGAWASQGLKDWGCWAYDGTKTHIKKYARTYVLLACGMTTLVVNNFRNAQKPLDSEVMDNGLDYDGGFLSSQFPQCYTTLKACYNDFEPLTLRYGMPWGDGQMEYFFRNGSVGEGVDFPDIIGNGIENFLIQRGGFCGDSYGESSQYNYQLVAQKQNVCRYIFSFNEQGCSYPLILTDWVVYHYK